MPSRYRRIISLVLVSVFVIGVFRQTSVISEEMVVWEIVINFATFGLWQIDYTHYERNEAYDELLTIYIAQYASQNYLCNDSLPLRI